MGTITSDGLYSKDKALKYDQKMKINIKEEKKKKKQLKLIANGPGMPFFPEFAINRKTPS